jgi:hypothetical protein
MYFKTLKIIVKKKYFLYVFFVFCFFISLFAFVFLIKGYVSYKSAYRNLHNNVSSNQELIDGNYKKFYESPAFSKMLDEEIRSSIIIENNATPDVISKKIIKDYILPRNIVTLDKIEHKSFLNKYKIGAIDWSYKPSHDLKMKDIISFDIFRTSYYSNITHFGFEARNVNNKKLFIHCSGHGAAAANYANSLKNENLLKFTKSISNEYDVLLLSMTDQGFNFIRDLPKLRFPTMVKALMNDDQTKEGHKIFEEYRDDNNLNSESEPMDGISLMLTGNYYLIKNTIDKKNYDKIFMLGHSGGGLCSTIYPAIIKGINYSVTYEGAPPTFLRYPNMFLHNDFENTTSKIYDTYNDLTFYKLGIFNKKNNYTNKKIFIYNDSNVYSSILKDMFEKIILDMKDSNIEYIKTTKQDHNIDFDLISKLIAINK